MSDDDLILIYLDTNVYARPFDDQTLPNIFVVLLERGQSDSVKEIADYWGDAGIEEIYAQVVAWKVKREASHPTQHPPVV